MTRIIFYFFTVTLLVINLGCRNTPKDDAQKSLITGLALLEYQKQATLAASGLSSFDNLATYYSTMNTFDIEVVYETGAAPYVGTFTAGPKSLTVWGILTKDIANIFSNRGQTMTTNIPTALSSMTEKSSSGKSTWTTTELLNYAKANRTSKSTSTNGKFFVAFLNGYLDDNGSANTGVIGVNLSGTPYTFIFKQVVESVSSGTDPVAVATKVYVEQSTLIHEIGHALGLVNNGVALQTTHQDTSNGKHCTNTECVMYYANTGTSALVTYLSNYITGGTENVMLKTYCLDDIKNFK